MFRTSFKLLQSQQKEGAMICILFETYNLFALNILPYWKLSISDIDIHES